MHTLGVVSYFNALPLWKPLAEISASIRIVPDVPANLGTKLQSGEVDAALLPIVDWFRLGGHLISDAGIAADGPVRSVLVFARRPPREWRTLGTRHVLAHLGRSGANTGARALEVRAPTRSARAGFRDDAGSSRRLASHR
jgi:hypothetical protein